MTALLQEEGEDLADTTTLTPPHLIEAHVPRQEIELSCVVLFSLFRFIIKLIIYYKIVIL